MKKGNEKDKNDKGKLIKGKSGIIPTSGMKGNSDVINKGKGGVVMKNQKQQQNNQIKTLNTNDKNELQKEIKDLKLPLNDTNYTKDIIDIDIKFTEDLLPSIIKRRPSFTKLQPSNKSILQSQSKQLEGESIQKIIIKIEKLYLDCLDKTEKVKLSNTSLLEDLLKQEVLYLKTKNEILKLKSDFFETIFYSAKNLIDSSSTLPTPSDLKEKLIGIFTQNNQHYYESFDFLQKKQFNVFSIEKSSDDNENLINQKCLENIKAIDNCLQSIMKNVNSFITIFNSNNNNEASLSILFKLKDDLLTCNKRLLSFYTLSSNFTYDFSKRSTLWLNNNEDYVKHDMLKRSKGLIDNFIQLSNPFINKVLTKKQRDTITKSILNIITFYENYNQILLIENSNLKCFSNTTMINLSNKSKALCALVNEYITMTDTSMLKFNEVIEFLYNNQAKNMEKVLYSLMNTDKEIWKNITSDYNSFVNKYNLIK